MQTRVYPPLAVQDQLLLEPHPVPPQLQLRQLLRWVPLPSAVPRTATRPCSRGLVVAVATRGDSKPWLIGRQHQHETTRLLQAMSDFFLETSEKTYTACVEHARSDSSKPVSVAAWKQRVFAVLSALSITAAPNSTYFMLESILIWLQVWCNAVSIPFLPLCFPKKTPPSCLPSFPNNWLCRHSRFHFQMLQNSHGLVHCLRHYRMP